MGIVMRNEFSRRDIMAIVPPLEQIGIFDFGKLAFASVRDDENTHIDLFAPVVADKLGAEWVGLDYDELFGPLEFGVNPRRGS